MADEAPSGKAVFLKSREPDGEGLRNDLTLVEKFSPIAGIEDGSCLDDIVVLRNGWIAGVDWWNMNVKVFSEPGHLLDQLRMPSEPYGMTLGADGNFAVTLPDSNSIRIISCQRVLVVQKSITTKPPYQGIAALRLDCRNVFFCGSEYPAGVDVVSQQGEIIASIIEDYRDVELVRFPYHVRAAEIRQVLISDWGTKQLICWDTRLQKVTAGPGEHALIDTQGIDTDESGYICLADRGKEAIYRLTPDSKIYFGINSLKRPMAVAVDRRGGVYRVARDFLRFRLSSPANRCLEQKYPEDPC